MKKALIITTIIFIAITIATINNKQTQINKDKNRLQILQKERLILAHKLDESPKRGGSPELTRFNAIWNEITEIMLRHPDLDQNGNIKK